MAYNNGFPATYQPMYYAPQYQQPMQQTPQMQQPTPQPVQNSAGIIWVQGEAGAKSYLVAPNNTVQLWDSERQTIYLKSADASGMPSMKALDYTIRDQTPANTPVNASTVQGTTMPDYATKADVAALAVEINAIRAQVDNMAPRKAAPKAKKEDEENG